MTNKFYSVAALFLLNAVVFAQVGVNTTTPKASLDIKGTNYTPTGTVEDDGKATLRIDGNTNTKHVLDIGTVANAPWGSYLQSRDKNTSSKVPLTLNPNGGNVGVGTLSPQKTMHVNGSLQVANELNVGGNATTAGSSGTVGQVLKSNGAGVAPSWQTDAAASTLYNSNGTLSGNRVVTQEANRLSFTGSAVNSFSVDGSTLSVDAANDRVGMGTTAPVANLDIKGANYNPTGTAEDNGKAILRIDGSTRHALDIGTVDASPYGSYIQSYHKDRRDGLPLTINPNGGNIGIGTLNPKKTMHVNGSLQVVNELNVGGNATTAGSSGTAGQVLKSNGAGAAPSWQTDAAASTLYNSNGTLSGNRVVTQEANRLSFTGSAVNSFSVDGSTLSVDAANDRVGMGTTAPVANLDVKGTNYTPTGTVEDDGKATLRIDGNTKHVLDIGTVANAPWGSYLQSRDKNTSSKVPLTLNPNGGNVGVGTLSPQKTMHVNGSLQVANELNVGGNATTAGSSGTAGQVLKSNGAGVAPSWETDVAASTLYNSNGTLSGNRVVTQETNRLSFTGTAVNAFSVDGSTLSVDAANDRVGVGTATPQKKMHVNGSLQVVNELNVGGNATTAGSAGTDGQVLKSNGPGKAPTWQNLAGVPNATGTVIAVNGEFIVAQEIIVQMTADYVKDTPAGITDPIGNLTNKIIDNESRYSGNNTTNSFTVSADGIYQVTMNAQLTTQNGTNPVIGIWNNTSNQWVARVNDRFTVPSGAHQLQTYTLLTSIPMVANDTYSFRIANTAQVTVKHLSSGDTGSGPVTQISLKRLR